MTDHKQLENVKHLNYLCSMVTNDAMCTREIKSRVAMAQAVFYKKKALLTRKFDLNLRKKLTKCCTWSTELYGAETWTLRKVEHKYLEAFEMWCIGGSFRQAAL